MSVLAVELKQPGALSLALIDSLADLEEIEVEWNQCLARSPEDAPYLRNEWLSAWYAADPGARPVRVFIAREAGRLVGIAPLSHGTLSFKKLGLPTLSAAVSGISPRFSAIAEDNREDVFAALVGGIERSAALRIPDRVFAYEFSMLAEDSEASRKWIDAWRAAGLPVYLEQDRISPYLSIPPGVSDFSVLWAEICSKHQQRVFKQKLRRAEKEGCRLEHVREAGRAAELMKVLLDVSARSWKGEISSDMAGKQVTRRFYERFTAIAAERGWLSLWVLWHKQECIAFQYDLEYGGVTTALRSDFDMSKSFLSPGHVLRWHSLNDFIQRGGREFDFGGQDYEYKHYWTKSLRHHCTVLIPVRERVARALLFARDNSLMIRMRRAQRHSGQAL